MKDTKERHFLLIRMIVTISFLDQHLKYILNVTSTFIMF